MASNKSQKVIRLTPSNKSYSSNKTNKSNRSITSINSYRTEKMINNLASLLKK